MQNITIKYLGHTTVYIECGDLKLITDPNFSKKHFFLKRLDKPLIDSELLHQVNTILISSAHKNRLHPHSFKYFKQTSQMILPLGFSKWVNTYFSFRLTELKANAQTTTGQCDITAIQSLHKSFRSFQLARPAYHYILKLEGKTILYCSDTPYDGSFFFDVGKAYDIDVAILPVDHISPDFIARKRHMNIQNAFQALQDLGAKKIIPYNFGSFNFSKRKIDKMTDKINKEAEKAGMTDRLLLLKPGEKMSL